MKQQRAEMWWVILAKSKTLRFFAVSCEFILFLGGLWITLTVNDPAAKTLLGGNINMVFLTVMGWAIDAAMPEAWLHVVIQHVEKRTGQLSWSKFVAICISLLFVGNIVYSIFTSGDTSDKVGAPTDVTGWILLCLTILRITVGFVYITVRQCQEWIDRQNQPASLPPAQSSSTLFDTWPLTGMIALLQQQIEEQGERQNQRVNLVDLQVQRLLSEVQHLQAEPAPMIDYSQLARAIMPQLRANIEGHVKAIWEENQGQFSTGPEPAQLEARATSQKARKTASEPREKPEAKPAAKATGNPEERLQAAYELLLKHSIRVSGRVLAKEAHVNRATATKWLSERPIEGQIIPAPEPEK